MFPGRLKLWIHRWFSFDWVGAVYPRLFHSIHKPARFKALALNRGLLCQSAWDSVELIKKSRNSPASVTYDTLGLGLSKKPVGLINDMNIIIIIVIIIFIIILYCYYYLNISRCSSLFRCSGVLVFRCFCVPAYSGLFQRVPVFLMFTVSLFIPCRFSRQTKQFSGFHDEPWSQNFFWSCASKLF